MKSLITTPTPAPYFVIYWAILKRVLVPMNTLEKAQMPKMNGPSSSLRMYLSSMRMSCS